MTERLPIRFQEHLQLQNVGINAASVGFNTLTMESDKFICVRETINEQNQVVIIDLADPLNPIRRPITADSAIINPNSKIIALKAQKQLQIFNIETKTKLKSHLMPEEVVFWKWITPKLIGLVTELAVYHWSLESDTLPVKIFDRLPSLTGCQIINYRINSEEKWMLLVGISAQQGRVVGSMQLFSKERGVSQPIEGHAGVFADFHDQETSVDYKLFSFSVRTLTGAKLYIVEIDHKEGTNPFIKKSVDIFFPSEATSDFPVSMQVSEKYSIIYLITKYGFIHLYDLESGSCIFMNRISSDTIFVTALHEVSSGIIGVNRKGQVLSVSIDEQNLIPHLASTSPELAMKLAGRCNLPGAEDLYIQQFNSLMQMGNFNEAAKVAANSPKGILRTRPTIETFKSLTSQPGTLSPILVYFSILLEKGDLNEYESIELSKPVLAQGKKQLLEKWLKEDKLECTEELGDIVKQHDLTLALSVYLRAQVPLKVISCFMETLQFHKIILYAKKTGHQPDYQVIFKECVSKADPEKVLEFAKLSSAEEPSLLSSDFIFDSLIEAGLVQQATNFMLDVLKGDNKDQGYLQTKLLELNLVNAPQVADAILSNQMFSHFDKQKIGILCEKANLFQRAIELYSDSSDIKRCIGHVNNPEWLVNIFGKFSVSVSLDLLKELLNQKNLNVVVQIAIKYSDELGVQALIELFESIKSYEGLFHYLSSVITTCKDPEVHFKYIQASCRTGQLKQLEKILKESNYFEPEKVKNFLKEAKLADQLPLIIVCDRFNFIHDLVLFLYSNNLFKYIETFVLKVNPVKLPLVVGALIDVDCEETIIKALIASMKSPFSTAELTFELEKRNRLKLLTNWLESQQKADSTDPEIYNALAKIQIDSNNNLLAETFLKENKFYNSNLIGKYCEKRNPFLAFIAFERGNCDSDLIRLCLENSMYKQLARYLIRRRDPLLWKQILKKKERQEKQDKQEMLDDSSLSDSLSRSDSLSKSVVDQVITILPDAIDPEDVSVTVQAFMEADLPNELILLLEKLVMEKSIYSDNPNLQNLLILTAIKNSNLSRLLDYINQLENYDAPDIANLAISNNLFEEAFAIYKKYKVNSSAISVLIENIKDLNRALDFALNVDQIEVWSKLAKAQLKTNISLSIESFIKAQDPSQANQVIIQATREQKFKELESFLLMALKKQRDPSIEGELLFVYAKLNKLNLIEEMLPNTPSSVNLIGDKCFDNQLYQASKLFFLNSSNYQKLSLTCLHLRELNLALDYAKKANSPLVWSIYFKTCLELKELKLAQISALNLIFLANEVDQVIKSFESFGYFDELVQLFELGLDSERCHMGLTTELAILYSKYSTTSAVLMDYLKKYITKINIPKVIRACEAAHQWNELVFLYINLEEFDNAITTMIKHSATCFDHETFKKAIKSNISSDLSFKILKFYLVEQPLKLNDLLISCSGLKLDPSKIISFLNTKNTDANTSATNANTTNANTTNANTTNANTSCANTSSANNSVNNTSVVALIKKYLQSIQSSNIQIVNQSLNDLYIEELDFYQLEQSIEKFDNFDSLSLACKLEKSEFLIARKSSSTLFKRNKKYSNSISILKQDFLYLQAIETVLESRDQTLAHDLLKFFFKNSKDLEFFATCLFTCFDLIRPDIVLELSFKNEKLKEICLPFFCQTLKYQHEKIIELEGSRK